MNDDDKNCCDCQSAFTSSKDVIKTELFDIGETLFFTNDGWSGLVKVKSLSFDESNVLRIVVSNSNGKDIITTKERLLLQVIQMLGGSLVKSLDIDRHLKLSRKKTLKR